MSNFLNRLRAARLRRRINRARRREGWPPANGDVYTGPGSGA